MTRLTDEQIKKVIIENNVRMMVPGPLDALSERRRVEVREELERTTQEFPDMWEERIAAMRAALHTLGHISVHRPVTRYAVSWLYVLWETPEDDDDYEEVTVCDACYKAQKEALDIYAIDDYRSAVWPCPVAQADEKENRA